MKATTLYLPICPHCRVKKIGFYLRGQHNIDLIGPYIQLWECNHCGMPICSMSNYHIDGGGHTVDELSVYFPVYDDKIAIPEHLPEDIANDLLEAKSSLENHNYKAACIMAGSAIETACVLFGATNGGLKGKINILHKEGIITKNLADWAQNIREIRVDAAHQAERQSKITHEDAEQAVYFAEMLFTYLFTLPGMIEERRKKS